jgi:hypothetical protein
MDMPKIVKKILVIARTETNLSNLSVRLVPMQVIDWSSSNEEMFHAEDPPIGFFADVEYDFDAMTAKIIPTKMIGERYFQRLPLQVEEPRVERTIGGHTTLEVPESTAAILDELEREVTAYKDKQERKEEKRRKKLERKEKPVVAQPEPTQVTNSAPPRVFDVNQTIEKQVIPMGIPGCAPFPIPEGRGHKIPASKRRTPGKYCVLNKVDDVIMEFDSEAVSCHFADKNVYAYLVVAPDGSQVWPTKVKDKKAGDTTPPSTSS